MSALEAARDALTASLVRTDVYLGHVPKTPSRPYVVLTATSPAVARRPLSGLSHFDRQTVMAMSVNNSLEGCLALAARVRDALDGLELGGPRLRYDFASAPIEDDNSGDYRWSLTADYYTHTPRRPHAHPTRPSP